MSPFMLLLWIHHGFRTLIFRDFLLKLPFAALQSSYHDQHPIIHHRQRLSLSKKKTTSKSFSLKSMLQNFHESVYDLFDLHSYVLYTTAVKWELCPLTLSFHWAMLHRVSGVSGQQEPMLPFPPAASWHISDLVRVRSVTLAWRFRSQVCSQTSHNLQARTSVSCGNFNALSSTTTQIFSPAGPVCKCFKWVKTTSLQLLLAWHLK